MAVTFNYLDAMDILIPNFVSNKPAKCSYEEMHALITHWLQSPNEPAIYGGDTLSKRWRKLLVSAHKVKNNKINHSENPNIDDEHIDIEFDGGREGPTFSPPINYNFKFIDLFSGIGGFRLALENGALDKKYKEKYGINGSKGKCVFSSEKDERVKDTYFKNYGEYPFGDIRKFTGSGTPDEEIDQYIPDHDVLAAGFPCQPFSRAGVSARNSLNQDHGFECDTEGTLFHDIARIARAKRPKVLFLENVQNIVSHDNGETFKIIRHTIEKDLDYSFSYAILNSSSVVPQRRKRCYMVCFRDSSTKFDFGPLREYFDDDPLPLRRVLQDDPEKTEKHIISDKLWEGHQRRTERNLERGTGFTAFTADLDKPSNTLVSRYGKDGKECLIPREEGNPRMLTPREFARLQGFPEKFELPDYKTPAYEQLGNSVAVPVVAKIAEHISDYISEQECVAA